MEPEAVGMDVDVSVVMQPADWLAIIAWTQPASVVFWGTGETHSYGDRLPLALALVWSPVRRLDVLGRALVLDATDPLGDVVALDVAVALRF